MPKIKPTPGLSIGMQVVAYAAELRKLDIAEIYRGSRIRYTAHTRFAVIYALREIDMTWKRIANAVGYDDHTSAIHGYREAQRLREIDAVFCRLSTELKDFACLCGHVRDGHFRKAA